MPKLTTEEVNKRLSARGITLVGEWQKSSGAHSYMCSKKHVWKAKGSHILNGGGCQKCLVEERTLTQKEVIAKLKKTGLQILDTWQGSQKRYRFKCSFGHTWVAKGTGPVTGTTKCPKCFYASSATPTEDINKRLKHKSITVVGEWKGVNNTNTFSCKRGHTWQLKGKLIFAKKAGCSICKNRLKELIDLRKKCSNYNKLDRVTVNNRLQKYTIKLIGPWNGYKKYNTFECALGHQWRTQGQSVLALNRGCPECARLTQKNRHSRGF